MKRKIIVTLALVMTITLLFSQSLIPVATAAVGGTNLPFMATLVGTAHWDFPGSTPSYCTVVTTLTEATGQATHMGRISTTMSHCPAEADIINDGRLTLTAANGDELYGTYNYDPASESNDIPITFIGGTGLFADASGAALLTYEVVPQFIPGCNPDPDPFFCMDFSAHWPWAATMTGTISY
jgi:hypothetical protein